MKGGSLLETLRRALGIAEALAALAAVADGGIIGRLAAEVVADPAGAHDGEGAAETCGMTSLDFFRDWRQVAGFGYAEFVERARLDRALVLFGTTDHNLGEVALEAGFDDAQGLREALRDTMGLTVTDVRLFLRP